ncbi:MAG: tRNA (adenine-N1)-methyltransferase [Chloroflexi bacterium]|nr:tRNA (adenine-N1)-methyltransferase [Chloroflexota bacterium]
MTAIDKNCFQPQDMVLLIDRKGRRYLKTLEAEQVFHSHLGRLYHDQLIGQSVGGWYRTDKGHVLLAVRPTFGDFVTAMPRGPQIIYPKDLGNIVIFADIFPGATVIEGGLGSGALTSALLRAVGPAGRVITYEIDEKWLPKAQRNIESLVEDPSNLTITVGDIYQGIAERDVDRVVLDVPEPWQAVETIGDALVMGGRMLSFLPTILQVHQLVTALEDDGRFQLIDSFETLLRPWHLKDRSVRPVHRMIAHSGFLTTAVRCQPRGGPPAQESAPANDIEHENQETSA